MRRLNSGCQKIKNCYFTESQCFLYDDRQKIRKHTLRGPFLHDVILFVRQIGRCRKRTDAAKNGSGQGTQGEGGHTWVNWFTSTDFTLPQYSNRLSEHLQDYEKTKKITHAFHHQAHNSKNFSSYKTQFKDWETHKKKKKKIIAFCAHQPEILKSTNRSTMRGR